MRIFNKVINDISFFIKAEEQLEAQAETLFSIISNFPIENVRNSFSFEIYGNIYILKKEEDIFKIQTYDYLSNSIGELTDDLTLPLWMQLEQGHLLRRLNIDGKIVKFNDKVIFAEGVFDSGNIFLQRSFTSEKGDSGWFIGHKSESNSNLKACYVYQLLKLKRDYIQFLALPDEYLVVIENTELKAILNEKNINILL